MGRNRKEKNMKNARVALGIKHGVPYTVEAELEDNFPGSIDDLGRQPISRFAKLDGKRKLAACQAGQLMAKFGAMATKSWTGWCLEEFFDAKVKRPMEYVIHRDQVSAYT